MLKEKIIYSMKSREEWGEFFPLKNSPYCYNESLAQQFFPLSKEEIIKQGLSFKEEEENTKYIGTKKELPSNISSTPLSISKEILECSSCSKNYRIVEAELEFHKKIGIMIPENCPKCRQKNRGEIMGNYIFK